MSNWPLLSLLIWLPILGGFATLAFGDRAGGARGFALLVLLSMVLLLLKTFYPNVLGF